MLFCYTPEKTITLDDKLPKTPEELMKSSIFDKLSYIAEDSRHPTQKLAVCMQKILRNLPENIIEHHAQLSNNALLAIVDLADEKLTQDQIQLMLSNKKFCASVEKIYTAVNDILLNLKSDPNKHQDALNHSKSYFTSCFNVLEAFHKEPAKDLSKQQDLIGNLNHIKEDYCQKVLGKDRSALSQVVRYLLKGVVNFIAGLVPGAHHMHYKATGHALFYANTNSQDKLEQLHHKISKEIDDDGLSNK